MFTSRPARTLASVSIAVSLLAAAGCGKAAEKVAEKATEEAIENQTGGQVDLDVDGEGGVSIETEDGSISSSAKVPEGWPDDVPVPDDLQIMMGGSQDTPQGLVLTVSGLSSTEPKALLEEFKVALADWEISGESSLEADSGNVAGAQWELDGRRVVLSATSGGQGNSQVLIAHTAAP